MNKNFSKLTLFASMGLFGLSLTQTAYCTTNLCRSGIDCLITGAFGMASGGAAITWLANPILILSWVLANRKLLSVVITSLISTSIALSFLLFHGVVDNEAGHINKIITYQSGYWLWVASCIIMLAGNGVLFFVKPRIDKIVSLN